MKKDNLLSIGALSKQTGVHIKSLRYYDSLGILRPVYVDPGSGYRYYSLQQIPVVDAIQLCVDLGIPLKDFMDYYIESSSQIHYAKLVEHGTALAREKIQTIQGRLLHCQGTRKELFFGIGVDVPQGARDLPENILHLPAGEYLCCKQAAPAIESAANIFPEQFALDYEKYVVESELPLGDYDCAAPPFELCCSLSGIQLD